ncbi:lipid-A-disaccharide synthase N-terminal domain-containing protein [Bacteroidales bacterium MB20-C3-3]|nr:lipid-A-disaccharide synthase N-terminal domain-containing protein [Bacteroidales bacterium MB20-C3-3]
MLLYAIGLTAQLFFGARTLFQWVMSERARKSLSPSIYWILSMVASWLFFIYGWMREDFAIILGQVVSYYIYIWNLDSKGIWRKIPVELRVLLAGTPPAAIILASGDAATFITTFLQNESVPIWLLIFGTAGQLIFTLRFVYQLIYSYRKRESLLPLGFWIISVSGSAVIIAYGIIRRDPILLLGQVPGIITYLRNIALHKKYYGAGGQVDL